MIALADLKPGQRVYIYGDVPVEVLSVKRWGSGWATVIYRAVGSELTGRFVSPAYSKLRLVEESMA